VLCIALAFIAWNIFFLLSLWREQQTLQQDTALVFDLMRLNSSINTVTETINYDACKTHGIAREAVWATYYPYYKINAQTIGRKHTDYIIDDNRIDQVHANINQANDLNDVIVGRLLNGLIANELCDQQHKLLTDAQALTSSIISHINARQEETSKTLSEKWQSFTVLLIIWFTLALSLALLVIKYINLTRRHEEIEGSLLDSESDLRTIFEHSAQHFILVDERLQVKKFNELANSFITQCSGRPLRVGDKIDHHYLPHLSLPAQRAFEQKLLRALHGEALTMEEQIVHNATSFWYQLDLNPVRESNSKTVTGVCITALNITQRKRAEDSLTKSEERFRSLVKHSTDLIAVLSSEGNITYSSASIRSILGYTPEMLLGRSVFDFIDPRDLNLATDRFLEALKEKNSVVTAEVRFRKPDQSWIVLECVINNLLDIESIKGIVINARDITKRVQLEQQLIQAKETAEELSRLKSSFLANMSHEIRTPMTAVIGFAGVLTELLEVPEQREYAESILNSGTRLLTTINGILDLAKIEANRYELHSTPTDIGVEIRRVIAMLEPLAREKSLRLDYSVDGSLPLLILDGHALGQVLTNLIGNAIKFTKQGSVFVTMNATADSCSIEVIDTGIGISSDFLPFVFDEFRQESGGLSRNFEGTGLGLAISKKIVTLMGGELSASSEVGVGSCFRIVFPSGLFQENASFAALESGERPTFKPNSPIHSIAA